MHFVQTALALLAAGAAVLLVAGLVLEALRENEQNLRLAPDVADDAAEPEAAEVPDGRDVKADEDLEDAIPFPHSRADRTRRDKRARIRTDEEQEPDRERRKERRRKERRNRQEGRTNKNRRTTSAETEDV